MKRRLSSNKEGFVRQLVSGKAGCYLFDGVGKGREKKLGGFEWRGDEWRERRGQK